MKVSLQTAITAAALLSAAQPCLASSQHRHHHIGRRHSHSHTRPDNVTEAIELKTKELKARGLDTCKFPSGEGLVAVTPSGDNAGWAMSPDQPCTCGSYCPYACPPGQVMAQWKDGSSYATTERMAGGMFCGLDGKPVKPFTGKSLCVDGTGTVEAVNKVGKVVSFCQTVLPGNEDILIPNDVSDTLTLAVPDPSYWDSTASHFYINPPGVDSDKGCHWGDSSQPIGNWAPYVAGANTDSAGLTYTKLGLNPIWQGSDLFGTKPTFGLKIECPSGGCNGLPCAIDGNGVTSDLKATGAGGSDFCVVTVPKGGKANIVVYNLDGSSASSTSSFYQFDLLKADNFKHVLDYFYILLFIVIVAIIDFDFFFVFIFVRIFKAFFDYILCLQLNEQLSEDHIVKCISLWSRGPASTATALSGSTDGSGGSSVGSAVPSESSKSESSAAQGNGAIAGLIVAIIAAACIL
ncbi:hypothetical protein TruAng_008175 [Truncatella angustata]|nr:hypothetical protein TruAng_008175 [Truncatella angustata]